MATNTPIWTDTTGATISRHVNPQAGLSLLFFTQAQGAKPIILFDEVVVGSQRHKLTDAQVISLIKDRYLSLPGMVIVAPKFAIRTSATGNLVLDPCILRRDTTGFRMETATKRIQILPAESTLLDFQGGKVFRPELDLVCAAKAVAAWDKSVSSIAHLSAPSVARKFGFDALGASAEKEGQNLRLTLHALVDNEWHKIPVCEDGIAATFVAQSAAVPISEVTVAA